MKMKKELKSLFVEKFGDSKDIKFFRSPGRVNLIGEHTDYNNGFVFPAAISLEIRSAARLRKDSKISVWSEDFKQYAEWDLKDLSKSDKHWVNYIKGVVSRLPYIKNGFDAVFYSDLPPAAGLSSSAAFELLNFFIITQFNGIEYKPKDAALECQSAENNYIGVKCGIMDQFAIALGKKSSALFLDTSSLEYRIVSFNLDDFFIVISNTNKPRTLANSAYNQRRKECEETVSIIKTKVPQVNSLRDLSLETLEKYKELLNDVQYRRAKHVIEENSRVIESVSVLEKDNLKDFGRLMRASHDSLKNLYEVSCVELDILVEESLNIDGVLGSRMTGAGFGGCTVSIVRKDIVEEFKIKVGQNYFKKTGIHPDFYVVNIVDGTGYILD